MAGAYNLPLSPPPLNFFKIFGNSLSELVFPYIYDRGRFSNGGGEVFQDFGRIYTPENHLK